MQMYGSYIGPLEILITQRTNTFITQQYTVLSKRINKKSKGVMLFHKRAPLHCNYGVGL